MITVVCEDPKKGEIEYTIKPMIFTIENLTKYWQKASEYPTLFNTEIRSDFGKFASIFVDQDRQTFEIKGRGLVWTVDTEEEEMVGTFYMTEIDIPIQATVHFSFFDGRIRGRAPLAKALMKHVFEEYGFVRLNVEIPVYVKSAAFRFIDELGFIKEGRKRKAVRYADKYFDTVLFGILKEEYLGRS